MYGLNLLRKMIDLGLVGHENQYFYERRRGLEKGIWEFETVYDFIWAHKRFKMNK